MDSGKVDYVDIQVFMPLFGVKKKKIWSLPLYSWLYTQKITFGWSHFKVRIMFWRWYSFFLFFLPKCLTFESSVHWVLFQQRTCRLAVQTGSYVFFSRQIIYMILFHAYHFCLMFCKTGIRQVCRLSDPVNLLSFFIFICLTVDW